MTIVTGEFRHFSGGVFKNLIRFPGASSLARDTDTVSLVQGREGVQNELVGDLSEMTGTEWREIQRRVI